MHDRLDILPGHVHVCSNVPRFRLMLHAGCRWRLSFGRTHSCAHLVCSSAPYLGDISEEFPKFDHNKMQLKLFCCNLLFLSEVGLEHSLERNNETSVPVCNHLRFAAVTSLVCLVMDEFTNPCALHYVYISCVPCMDMGRRALFMSSACLRFFYRIFRLVMPSKRPTLRYPTRAFV